MQEQSKDTLIISIAMALIIFGIGFLIKRSISAEHVPASVRIHTDCGYINNIFEIQGNVLGMSEDHEICAYNFSLKKWQHIQEPEAAATSTPAKP